MIKLLAILGAFNCMPTEYINENLGDWDDHDKMIIENNKNFCYEKFGKEAPCLKRFVKRPSFQTYWIICTWERK